MEADNQSHLVRLACRGTGHTVALQSEHQQSCCVCELLPMLAWGDQVRWQRSIPLVLLSCQVPSGPSPSLGLCLFLFG